MNRLRLSVGIFSIVFAAVACGEIADPTKEGEGTVSTISGALTATNVPSGAHVALVWKKAGGGLEVGSDTAIGTDGKFTLTLGVPQASYFFPYESKGYDRLSGGSSASSGSDGVNQTDEAPNTDPPPEPAPAPGGSSGGGKLGGGKITPKGGEVSGQITQPLNIAVAGFVVYVDKNGNNKLDLEGEYGSSPDSIIGGNDELLLAYLKDGGSLDYEKLRDKSGILPKAGYNLAWERGRWLPLNLVELQLKADMDLPGAVCDSSGVSDPGDAPGVPRATPVPAPPPGEEEEPVDPDTKPPSGGSYPKPGDPNLKCSPDGKSFSYSSPCPTPPPPPVGLCANGGDVAMPGCMGGYASTLPSNGTVPEGWPCPVTATPDGGTSDAGTKTDAGADGG